MKFWETLVTLQNYKQKQSTGGFPYPISELTWPLRFPADVHLKLNFGPQHGSRQLWGKTCNQRIYFSCCLIFLPITSSHWLKKGSLLMSEFESPKLTIFLVEVTFSSLDWYCSLCWIFRKFLINNICRNGSFNCFMTLQTVTSFPVTPSWIFLSKCYKVFRTAVFKTIF